MNEVSLTLRRLVIARAHSCCEYCLLSSADDWLPFEVDHVIALKHLGESELYNLAWSCYRCNHAKGSDIASIDRATGLLAPLFNPRTQRWADHFQLNAGIIEPLTPEGRVTVFLLQFNDAERVIERDLLIELGQYPCRSTDDFS